MVKSKEFPALTPTVAPQANARVLPRQVTSGQLAGVQGVGDYGLRIDNGNRRMYCTTADGSMIGFGNIPNSDPAEFGFFTIDPAGHLIKKTVSGEDYYYDTSGNLLLKIIAGTSYYYRTNGENDIQIGILPDGTHNVAIAKSGYEVADAITA